MADNEEIIVDAEVWEPEQEDSIMLLSCKKCGNNVPAHYEFCPYCKNRLKKKKRKKSKVVLGLVITLLSLSTIASTLCAIIYRDWYVDAIYDKNIVTEQLDHMMDLYNELKQQQETATARNSIPVETPRPTIRPTPQPTAAPIQPSQQGIYAVESCAIPRCDNAPSLNSFYCSRHECLEPGCHNSKANDLCQYCTEHKCAVPNCNSKAAYNSFFCYIHED